jgi:hypothetical protein
VEVEDAIEDTHCRGPVQTADVGTGCSEPFDAIREHLPVQREVFRLESKLSHHVVHGDALAVMLTEPSLSLPISEEVFFGYRFVIVDHDFQQLNDGSEFIVPEAAE